MAGREFSFDFDATLDNLERVRDFVEAAGVELGASRTALADLKLAVDEAVTNVVLHGYRGEGGPVTISIVGDGADVVVRIRDQAAAFDPSVQPDPKLDTPLEERAFGGMGLFLIRKMTDAMEFAALKEQGNELRLLKRGALSG